MGSPTPIDRHALVQRHHPVLRRADVLAPLSVGNGEFAFTADITGLQTFPEAYRPVPLCTQAQWGWHTSPPPAGVSAESFRLTPYATYGRTVGYPTRAQGQEAVYGWLRENPHRLHLGRIGWILTTASGRRATLEDITGIDQTLDLWSGTLTSRFRFDGAPVVVRTCVHPTIDAVAVQAQSPLFADGRAAILLAFPYGSPQMAAADWDHPARHQTAVDRPTAERARFLRRLDADTYEMAAMWSEGAQLTDESRAHTYRLDAAPGADRLHLACAFAASAADCS